MNAIITNNIQQIETLCKKHKVKELYAFGSVTDEKRFNEMSDVDLLVDFKQMPVLEYADNYFDLLFEFENLFERKVDLVTSGSMKNPVFIRVVNRTKVPVVND